MEFFLLTLLLASTVTAIENSTEEFQGWKAEPDTDSGTASVVWQCLTTIGLCTYVVVHVNITPTPLGQFASFLRKCLVVLIEVIFPEVWAWGAVSQLLEARKLVKESERIGQTLSLKQAFFIYSGGVTIRDLHQAVPSMEARDMRGKDVFVNNRSVWFRDWRKTLSDKEITMFARSVPTDEEIDDKSKQDTLVKIVTSLQALWFVVQLAARAQQGLVVAPMQIGTLAYVSMAAFTYGCWWQKAYDINVPRALDGKSEVTIGSSDVDSRTWVVAEDHEKFTKMLTNSRIKFLRSIVQAFHEAVRATMYDIYSIIVIGSNHIMIMGGLTSIFTSIHCAA
ncbi:hypothetical protein MMC10_009310 [Thelotrema lepadinum]|nr:hypothetical protein [Thelotrema lepadinum]